MTARRELLEEAMRQHARDGLIGLSRAAQVADTTLLDPGDRPWIPVLRIADDVDPHTLQNTADALADVLSAAYPNATPLLVMHHDVDVDALNDEDLARLGLIRLDRAVELVEDHFLACSRMTPDCLGPVLRSDTPTTGVDEIPD